MKKYYILLAVLFFATNVNAGVRAIGENITPHATSGELKMPKNNKKNNEKLCKKYGFTKSKCPKHKTPTGFCPYDNSYFIKCCPNDYRHIASECYKRNLIPSVDTCFGLHACIEPKIKKEDKDNPVAPK
jgi:hypothetical protein